PSIQFVGGMNDDGLPRPENMPAETRRRARLRMKALAMIQEEGIASQIGFRIKQTDRYHIGSEYFADLVADQIVDGLHLQFRCQTFLHAVDHRKLGGALLGLLAQPLRFIKEAGVLLRQVRARRRRSFLPFPLTRLLAYQAFL